MRNQKELALDEMKQKVRYNNIDDEVNAIVDDFYEKSEPQLFARNEVLKGWHRDRVKDAMLDALSDKIRAQNENDETIQRIISIIKGRL